MSHVPACWGMGEPSADQPDNPVAPDRDNPAPDRDNPAAPVTAPAPEPRGQDGARALGDASVQPDNPGRGPGSRRPAGQEGGEDDARRPRGRKRRAVAATVMVALVAAFTGALVGGLAGGYIGFRSADSGTQPGFSLGTVAPAMTNRAPDSVAGIAARVMPSVVMIKVNGSQGTGSGFIVHGGYIVTDNHVVTLDGQLGHATLQVVFDNGEVAAAQLVGRDPYSDLAVIRPVTHRSWPAVTLGNSGSLDVGDPVMTVGSPLGLAGTVTSGIVSALNRPVQPGSGTGSPQVFYDAIQTDAPINPGNSGGPLVNGRGQVIGVDAAIDTLNSNPITGSQGGSIGLGFAIPINQARRVVTELIRSGQAVHAVIGALLNTAYAGLGAQILASARAISPGGPAARAGLRPGDVVVKFGGQPIVSAYTLIDAVRSAAPGSRVAVVYLRNGATRTARLKLGSASS